MKVIHKEKVYELQGGSAWTEVRFESLKKLNEKGKVVIVETFGNKDKFLVPIGELEVQPEPRNY